MLTVVILRRVQLYVFFFLSFLPFSILPKSSIAIRKNIYTSGQLNSQSTVLEIETMKILFTYLFYTPTICVSWGKPLKKPRIFSPIKRGQYRIKFPPSFVMIT